MPRSDVVVVGGGLAGLAAATLLTRAQRKVVLLERTALGGRARSQTKNGFTLNLGPHALYRTGAARALLRDLQIAVPGAAPPTRALGLVDGALTPLPFDPISAATTPMLRPTGRLELVRWFAYLLRLDPRTLCGQTVADWLAPLSAPVLGAINAFVRVATYSPMLDQLDAGAVAAQLQRALRGVDYLHGGWQGVVDRLAAAARDAGVTIHTDTAVREVRGTTAHTETDTWEANAVLLAVAPQVASDLLQSPWLTSRTLTPLRAACLDLGLTGTVPRSHRLVLGVDRPLYSSVHSDIAHLAPTGSTLIHAAIYGAQDDPDAMRAVLGAALDLQVPDWRARVVVERWMPGLVVAHDHTLASNNGARVPSAVADRPGVWLAGDWVGDEGMLADAAAASARAAAHAILAHA